MLGTWNGPFVLFEMMLYKTFWRYVFFDRLQSTLPQKTIELWLTSGFLSCRFWWLKTTKKTTLTFHCVYIESRLFSRDPYNGLWYSPQIYTHHCAVCHLEKYPKQPGALFSGLKWLSRWYQSLREQFSRCEVQRPNRKKWTSNRSLECHATGAIRLSYPSF